MKIMDSSTLLQHLSTGSTFQVKNNELHTLKGPAKHLEQILNYFRSDQTIAAREARVLTAMSEILRPQSASGPSNLAAPRPQQPGQTPGEAIQNARMTLVDALIEEALTRLDVLVDPERAARGPIEVSAPASEAAAPEEEPIYEDLSHYPPSALASMPSAEENSDDYQSMMDLRAEGTEDTESLYDTPRSSAESPESLYATPRSVLAEAYQSQTEPRRAADEASSYDSPKAPVRDESLYDTPRANVSMPPALADAEKKLLHSALSSALGHSGVLHGASLSEIRNMVETATIQALINHTPGALGGITTGFTQDTRALINYQERLGQDMQAALDGALDHASLLFENDICISTRNSFHEERPVIAGSRLSADMDTVSVGSSDSTSSETAGLLENRRSGSVFSETNGAFRRDDDSVSLHSNRMPVLSERYEEMLSAFSPSPLERRIISYLMGPDGRLPVDNILSGTNMPAGTPPLNPNASPTLGPDAPGLIRSALPPTESYCTLSRNGHGDAILEFSIPLSASGQLFDFTLNNGRRIEVRANERQPVGELQYTILIPSTAVSTTTSGHVPLTLYGMKIEAHNQPTFVSGEILPAAS